MYCITYLMERLSALLFMGIISCTWPWCISALALYSSYPILCTGPDGMMMLQWCLIYVRLLKASFLRKVLSTYQVALPHLLFDSILPGFYSFHSWYSANTENYPRDCPTLKMMVWGAKLKLSCLRLHSHSDEI